MTADRDIEATILALAGARGGDGSICPSEVARGLAADWRPLLGPVRRIAARLARAGRIDILRKGRPIDPDEVRGVIRLRIRAGDGDVTPT
jgi:hypothetical protein